jgi:ATP/maltotriose-dependent transcriptional regulator MalT
MNIESNSLNSRGTQSLDERLIDKPALHARLHRLVDIVDDAAGDCKTANQAEARVIEEIRQIGVEALEGWSGRADEQAQAQVLIEHPKAIRDAKKNSTGTPLSEKSA